ncbi:Serine/threonine-protein kinase wnk2 [Saguinus oedipus]|uniref:Serine/threonine-protein kinase wnk2 n=1 Tax=Saguinus oedipus TaxID=9490 RepID=A0ABQ9W513_SAGOE|nr:Serine/threonine-protein kinase wnk2 [Saguinus oedipus]
MRTLLYQEHVPTSGTPVEMGDRDFTLEPCLEVWVMGDLALPPAPNEAVTACIQPPQPLVEKSELAPTRGAVMEQGTSSSMTAESSSKSMLCYDRDGGQDGPAFVKPAYVEPTDREGGVTGEISAEPPQSAMGISTVGGQASHPQTLGPRAPESPRKHPEQQDGSSPAKTVSTQDEWTLASSRSLRYPAPPDVYLNEGPSSHDVKLAVRLVQTSIEVGVDEPLSSASRDK